MSGFEYDAQKSVLNRSKHGIDFEEAQALWDDPRVLEIRARTTGEERFLVVGKIAERHWSAIITYMTRPRAHHLRTTLPPRGGGAL